MNVDSSFTYSITVVKNNTVGHIQQPYCKNCPEANYDKILIKGKKTLSCLLSIHQNKVL